MNNFFTDLYKKDTILAFIISFILYNKSNNEKPYIFSIKFVIIFLLCKNILNI